VVVGVEPRVWFFIRETMEDDILVESRRKMRVNWRGQSKIYLQDNINSTVYWMCM